jgi:hypothetical protein
MLKLDALVGQVLHNCDISDAQNAGLFSICGLALRLRDLFKWEHHLAPWDEKESSEILTWIGKKEELWESLLESDFHRIQVLEKSYDPFDTAAINTVVEPYGIFYGAGFARSLKPTFFLASISQKKTVDGMKVITLGRELARDILTLPALCQDRIIVLRSHSAFMYLWDQMLYIKKSGKPALHFALEQCGVPVADTLSWRSHLPAIFAVQKNTFVRHELAEINDTVFDPAIWREIIATNPHSPVELLARSLKDLLADTSEIGPLRHFVTQRDTAALAFYVAFFDGLQNEIFKELRPAFARFIQEKDWGAVEDVVMIGFQNAKAYTERMIDLFYSINPADDPNRFEREIHRRILEPLGCKMPGDHEQK